MKKLLAIGLSLIMCLSFCACNDSVGDENSKDDTNTETTSNSKDDTNTETTSKTYTYRVRAMQGVEDCIYYGPDAYVPNTSDPEAARNKVHIWTKCTTCGDCGERYHFSIPVSELDFSKGDTIQYTDTDSCWDCTWEKQLPSFMWVVEITRVSER